MTCTISCASMRARIKSSHFTVTVCPTDFCFKCETASLITSSTSWLVSSSFRRPSFSRVTYNRFSTTSISHSESSYISLYICCFVVSSKQFPLCKSVSALPEIEQRGVRRSCEIDLKRSARSCSLFARSAARSFSAALCVLSIARAHSFTTDSTMLFSNESGFSGLIGIPITP